MFLSPLVPEETINFFLDLGGSYFGRDKNNQRQTPITPVMTSVETL